MSEAFVSADDVSADRPERRRGGWRRARRLWHAVAGELHPERNRYRDLLVLVLVGVVAWAVITAVDATRTATRATATAARATATAAAATHTAHRALGQVQQGRATSIGVICAFESAIGEAGKETIGGSGVLPPALDMFLQRHGYPPKPVRERAARQAANRYIGSIGSHITKELRQRGQSPRLVKRLLQPDGTINCRELTRIAQVHVR